MYVFTAEQHCLLSLSAYIWRRRGVAKRHGLGFNEETATEVFLLDLSEQFPGTVKVVPFNRREEGRIGADWAWAFVGPDGQWCQSMLVQAKRLDNEDREYAELYYRAPAKGSQPSIAQLDRLIDNGRRLGLHAAALVVPFRIVANEMVIDVGLHGLGVFIELLEPYQLRHYI